jgi:hypothetical protein
MNNVKITDGTTIVKDGNKFPATAVAMITVIVVDFKISKNISIDVVFVSLITRLLLVVLSGDCSSIFDDCSSISDFNTVHFQLLDGYLTTVY